MTLSNEGEAVPAVRFAHRRPPHPSRNSPPSPLFSKERGDTKISAYNCSPSLILIREGEQKVGELFQLALATYHSHSLTCLCVEIKGVSKKANNYKINKLWKQHSKPQNLE